MAAVLAPLRWLGRNATWLLPLALVPAAFAAPVFMALAPWMAEMIIVLLAIALATADADGPVRGAVRPAHLVAGLVVMLVVLPVAGHGLALVAGLAPREHAALVLLLCAPPISASGNLARFAGLPLAPALVIMLTASVACVVVAPVLCGLLLPGILDLDPWVMARNLAYIFGGGGALALLLRRLVPAGVRRREAAACDGAGVVMLVLFLHVLLASGIDDIVADPAGALRGLALAFLAVTGVQVLAATLMASGGARPVVAGTWSLCLGGRNMAALFAALPLAQAEPLFMMIALVQPALYLVALVGRHLHVRLARQAGGQAGGG